MTQLHDLQKTFIDDIYTNRQNALDLIEEHHHDRLTIYQNNTQLSLIETLSKSFSVTAKLVGEGFFKTLAIHYIKAHPAQSGNLNNFGASFSTFIHDYEAANSLPYLSEVAAIEWAHLNAYIAPDAPTLTFDDLGFAIQDPNYVMSLHPSVNVIPVTYNADEIWHTHSQNLDKTLTLTPLKNTAVLVWRDTAHNILFKRIEKEVLYFITASQHGQPFATVLTELQEKGADIVVFQQEFSAFTQAGLFRYSVHN